MLMKQQQQQQCGPASRSEMECLIAALTASITAASIANSDPSSGMVDVTAMARVCADVDHVTIIGWSGDLGCMKPRLLTLKWQGVLFALEELPRY
jgi:hypothetical protein